MKEKTFSKSFWIFDGLIGTVFGFLIGRISQVTADSGEFLFKKVLTASLIGMFSYLLAFLVGFLFSGKFRKFPSWIWITILGAMLFAFNKYIVWYLMENCNLLWK